MSEVEDYFQNAQLSARQGIVASQDDDPEQAARAMDLSETSGVPPTAIYGDLDGFERRYKTVLSAGIINDNAYIADYLNHHPMAPRVSHDDLGALDDASRSISALQGESKLQKWLKSDSVARSFMEGFGEQPLGQQLFQRPTDVEWAISHPAISAVAGAASMPIEGIARTASGLIRMGHDGIETIFGKSFADEMAGMAEWAMMRGDIHAEPPTFNANLLGQMHRGLEIADQYTRAGLEPPAGVHPLIDEAKKAQAKEDIDALDQALKDSAKSATRERSPELFANFVRSHLGDREIGIDSEAVRRIYGDKVPTADDNLLGWIPDLDQKLAAAEGVGGDIRVPVADWLAHVEPEVAKELHDDIRVRDNGLTINETKIGQDIDDFTVEGDHPEFAELHRQENVAKENYSKIKNQWQDAREADPDSPETKALDQQTDEALKAWQDAEKATKEWQHPAQHSRPEPKEVVAEPVASTRGSAGLEPLLSVGDRKVTLLKKAPADITESDKARFDTSMFHDVDIMDERGNAIGTINISEQKGGKQLYIDMIQAGSEAKKFYQPNYLGPSLVRDIKRQLKQMFPNAESITGHRVSGAREKAGVEMTAPMPVVKLDVGEDPQSFRDLLQAHWEPVGGAGVEALFYTDNKGLAANSPMGQMVLSELRRVVPHVEADIAHDIYTPSGPAGGAYLPDIKNIIVSLESKDPLGTAHHEAIHGLRDLQFFTKDEWSTLEGAALSEGWMKKFRVAERWGPLKPELQIEESIAEAYRDWRKGASAPPEIHSIFEKMKAFFQGLLKQVADHLGLRADSWEDIFQKVESGEVGAREPVEGEGDAPKLQPIGDEGGNVAGDLELRLRQIGMPRHDATFHSNEGLDYKTGLWTTIPLNELQQPNINQPGLKKLMRDFKTEVRGNNLWVRTREYEPKGKPKLQPTEEEGPGLYDNAKALGVTQAHMDRMLSLIQKRNAEDLTASERRAEVRQRRRSNKEWKERRTALRDEVRESLASRPDLATDELLSKGNLKLHPDFLSEDQKLRLPKDYIQKKNGVSPDELAPYFGYTSGDSLVERLGMLTEDRRRSGMSARDYFNRLVDVETDRRLNLEFGNREQTILDEAKDQALSETQLNLVHEETLAYALRAGQEPQFTKEQTRAMVRQVFNDTPIGQISSDRLLQTAGKIGKKIEEAGAKGKWDEAYRLSQQRNHAVIAAKMARDYERERASLDRTAKQFRKREVASVPAEYTNWIHDILQRTGYPINRSIQDLAENIGRAGEDTLEKFRDAKEASWMGMRELPIADFLLDPTFHKKVDDLSHHDFMGLKVSLDSLVKAGRDESKIYREGEAADREAVLREMKDRLATFPLKDLPATRGEISKFLDKPRSFIAGMTNIETLLNRWDRADPRGIFNRYIVQPLAEASNSKNVLEREVARALHDLGPIEDRGKLVDAPFADPLSRTEDNPDGSRWTGFTRNNVMAMLQNAGNKSNWTVLARGYGADPQALMQWLFRNTTKADWDRAQQMGDKVFKALVAKADRVYERMTGATIEKIPLEPVQTPFGEYKGWYHPLIRDPERNTVWEQDPETGLWKQRDAGRKSNLDSDYFHASTSNGYTKKRTGATYPLDLNFDVVPARIKQMIHDIAFREVVHEVQKVFGNGSFKDQVTKHYGPIYKDLLEPYLRGIAGAESINSKAQSMAARVSEYFRQNVISTLIGFNPYTALKHGPTAWVMSMREVGGKDFLHAVSTLYGKSPELGLSSSEFAMKWSEELQRRERHWQDTIAGEHANLEGSQNVRQRVVQAGSWLVAQSDMLSAKPTWLAAYERSTVDGLSHGDAIKLADLAVRRAHGSTAATNQPALVRGGGPLHGWLTSVYGFFGTAMQRRIEIAHKLNDAYQLVKEGEINSAARNIPGLAADIFTYVMWPTIVEEWVTGLNQDDRRGLGQRILSATTMGLSSSVLYLRDMMHAFVTGQDPSVGLLSTPLHDMTNMLRQFKKGRTALDRKNAGKTVADTLTVLGETTGLAPKTLDNAIRFGIDLVNKQAHPKGVKDVLRGVTRGTEKLRVEK